MKRITVKVLLTLKQAQDLSTDYHNNADICMEPSRSRAWRRIAHKVDAAIAASKRGRGKCDGKDDSWPVGVVRGNYLLGLYRMGRLLCWEN